MSEKNNQQQELAQQLSCYLDGELSVSQTEKVERRLAEDAEARALLAELREVSEAVGSLPHVEGPSYLAETIQNQLERDILLEQNDALSELAGQKHLRWRRLITAAAMVLLTGAIGTIIYNVLKHPSGSKVGSDPVLVLNDSGRIETAESLKGAASRLGQGSPLAASMKAEAGGASRPMKLASLTVEKPVYTHLRMIVQTANPAAGEFELEGVLAANQIENLVRTARNGDRQYAFLCRRDQLRGIYQGLVRVRGHQIDLVVTEDGTGREVRVPEASESQALALAEEVEGSRRLAEAEEFRRMNRPELVAEGLLANEGWSKRVELGGEDLLTIFANDVDELLAKSDSELGHLRSMADMPEENKVVGPACPPEALAPSIAANEEIEKEVLAWRDEVKMSRRIEREAAVESNADAIVNGVKVSSKKTAAKAVTADVAGKAHVMVAVVLELQGPVAMMGKPDGESMESKGFGLKESVDKESEMPGEVIEGDGESVLPKEEPNGVGGVGWAPMEGGGQ